MCPQVRRLGVAAVMVGCGLAAAMSLQLSGVSISRATARSAPRSSISGAPTLPLRFVPNVGQAAAGVRFVVDASGRRIAFRDDGLDLWLAPREAETSRIGLRFAGRGRPAKVKGGSRAAGAVHYFLGRDRARWRSALPVYGSIVYGNLYPGIDLVYSAEAGAIESTWDVRPGADVTSIRVRCEGISEMTLDLDGSLVLTTPRGEVRESPPVAFQEGPQGRTPLAVRFTLDRATSTYGFRVEGGYDRRRPLTIDPTLAVSSYLGGSAEDAGNAIAVDATGQIYIAGYTASTNFPTQSPIGAAGGRGDAFVAKIAAGGSQLVYSTYFGGSERDTALGIAVDGSGQAFVTGSTLSTNFPIASSLQNANAGSGDAFVAKLSTSGTLIYSTFLGGGGQDVGAAIAVDTAGAAYVGGRTSSTNFPTVSAYQQSLRGVQDAFAAKLDAAGQSLVYATYLGGSDIEAANGIAINLAGEAHLTGYTGSLNFPVESAAQTTLGGNLDGFVTRLASQGTALLYSTYLGGGEDDAGNAIVLDSGGTASVTGYTLSADFPTQSAFQATKRGGSDAFLSRIAASGSTLVLSTYLGGSGQDEGVGIGRDGDNQTYVAGTTGSTDFPLANSLKSSLSGDTDVFVSQFASGGQSLAFSTYAGGSSAEYAFGMVVDSAKKVYVTGQTRSLDFTSVSARQSTFGGGIGDAFYLRIDPFEPTFVSSLYFPRLVTTDATSTTIDNSEYTGVAVVNLSSATATLKLSAFDTAGASISGASIANPVQLSLSSRGQLAMVDTQIFGTGLSAKRPIGWFRLESTANQTIGFFLVFNGTLGVLDGADVSPRTMTSFVFPEIEDVAGGFTQLHLPNPNAGATTLTVELVDSEGVARGTATRSIAANGTLVETVSSIFPAATLAGGMYVRCTATQPVVAFEYLGKAGQYVEGLNGQETASVAKTVYSPQYAVGGGWRTTLSVVNFDSTPTTLQLRLIGDSGQVLGSRTQEVRARGKLQVTAQDFFVTPSSAAVTQGYVQITSDRGSVGGSVVFGDTARSTYASALPLLSKTQTTALFSQVASDATYFTGLAVLNPGDTDASFVLDVFDKAGAEVATKTVTLLARRRTSQLLTQFFPTLPSMSSGYFRVTATPGLMSFALFGTSSLSVLSAVPPQTLP